MFHIGDRDIVLSDASQMEHLCELDLPVAVCKDEEEEEAPISIMERPDNGDRNRL